MTAAETRRATVPFECPECHEARVEFVGMTDDAKTQLRCSLCHHRWEHGGAQRPIPAGKKVLSYEEALAKFPTPSDVAPATWDRVHGLKEEFLRREPQTEAAVGPYWARYQQIFSAEGLATAAPADLKSFANTTVGAHPGNMSVFNNAWNELGDEAAARELRKVIDYLLRGPSELALEDRLQKLIDPNDGLGMTGFRESLLTKVLCVMHPDRFLPILIYTSPAGGKREIAKAVFDLELPAPEATSWTRGRLACWSNDLLATLAGDGFEGRQHAAAFLWWAKDASQKLEA